jgi:hypothetical protein
MFFKHPKLFDENLLRYADDLVFKFAGSLRAIQLEADTRGNLFPRFDTFRWRDSADHNQQKLMTLSLDEFLRRFLLHLLPKGFVRIRLFGFLANRRRSTLLPLCFAALGTVPSPIEPETSPTQESDPLWRCPKCGGPMAVIEQLTAAQIQLRSPPRLVTTAT